MKRTILITGATGKLGRIFVNHFLESGDNVIAVGRCKHKLSDVHSLNKSSDRLYLAEVDLLHDQVGELLIGKLSDLNLNPTCLINNARNLDFLKLSENGKISRQNFLSELTLDVVVPYELVIALASYSRTSLQNVVNIGSIYGSLAPNLNLYTKPNEQSAIQYGVAKAALAHLTKELAVRLAPQNIRVNCVAYGGVEGRASEEFKNKYAKLCPSGRMLKESEIAGPVDMLLSDSASGITGHVLMVDGGWSVW